MVDIVERLHYAGYNDTRLAEAANEIERLREGLKIASSAVENLEREVASQRKGIDAAVMIIRDYANNNPKHNYQGREQDPRGAHAWLAEFVRSDPPRKLLRF